MNRIDSIPSLNWTDHAKREIALEGEELLHRSDFVWKLGEAAICGLIYNVFTSPPWMWFAMSKDVTMGDLIDFRRLATMIPLGTLTGVDESLPVAIRFAEFYGFEETGSTHDYHGRRYKIFRRV